MTFFEQFTAYQRFMVVLNMSAEQLAVDPLARASLLEIRDIINEVPEDPMWVGLRPRVERLLGDVDWKAGSAS